MYYFAVLNLQNMSRLEKALGRLREQPYQGVNSTRGLDPDNLRPVISGTEGVARVIDGTANVVGKSADVIANVTFASGEVAGRVITTLGRLLRAGA